VAATTRLTSPNQTPNAVLRKQNQGLDRRLVQFRLRDPEPLLFHNEAIVRDGRMVGTITSGNYGHALGGAVGLGYVPCLGESVLA
jgi:glycine cleavage system aminomethyltransferase T